MPNIRIDLDTLLVNGQSVTFKSPADCSQVTGLIVYYPENDSTVSKTFQFADAHGNNVGSVSLFAEDVLVKVILDTELNRAYVQNADTNKYIEETFIKKSTDIDMKGHRLSGLPLPESGSEPATKEFVENFTVEGSTYVATDDNKDGNIVLRPYVADADELEFRDHIKNKQNPHGTTYDQVGAAPAGYGLGEQVYFTHRLSHMSDLDALNTTCFFALTLSTTETIHGVQFGSAFGRHLTFMDGRHYQELIMLGTLVKFERFCWEGEWSDWVDSSPSAFAPAGYGFGEEVKFVNNIDNLLVPGQYKFYNNGYPLINGVADTKSCNVEVISSGAGCVHRISSHTSGYCAERRYNGTTWGEWIRCDAGAFAPAGYGLGGDSKWVADINQAIQNGWYYTDPDTLNIPSGISSYTDVFVTVRGSAVAQHIRAVTNNISLVRYRTHATEEWIVEWETPPMELGVEYRTTERWNGKPVYQWLIDAGSLPNAATKTVYFSNAYTTVDEVIYCEGATSEGAHLPHITGVASANMYLHAGRGYVNIETGIDRSGITAKILVKYTKTTD